jgi:hypothetical protein
MKFLVVKRSPVVGGDLSQRLTEVEVINWVADYCGSHRDQLIADAAHEMIVYLFSGGPMHLRKRADDSLTSFFDHDRGAVEERIIGHLGWPR